MVRRFRIRTKSRPVFVEYNSTNETRNIFARGTAPNFHRIAVDYSPAILSAIVSARRFLHPVVATYRPFIHRTMEKQWPKERSHLLLGNKIIGGQRVARGNYFRCIPRFWCSRKFFDGQRVSLRLSPVWYARPRLHYYTDVHARAWFLRAR